MDMWMMVIGQLGLITAALVSSVFGWLTARKTERHVRPNGHGTIVEIVERNHAAVTEVLRKVIELDTRVDRIETRLGDR